MRRAISLCEFRWGNVRHFIRRPPKSPRVSKTHRPRFLPAVDIDLLAICVFRALALPCGSDPSGLFRAIC